jgi:hypothetical protein
MTRDDLSSIIDIKWTKSWFLSVYLGNVRLIRCLGEAD